MYSNLELYEINNEFSKMNFFEKLAVIKIGIVSIDNCVVVFRTVIQFLKLIRLSFDKIYLDVWNKKCQ